MTAPKVGALFAGYGGLELAVSDVFPDAHLAWVAEFDPAPSRILAQRFPDVPNLGDVTAVDWAAVEPVDIITGGSPCQDLSHAGKRAGMRAGTRSGLWASMCDAIEIIRPRLVVWENVRGALSAEADSAVEPCPICVGDGRGVTLRALGRVLGDLAELGYDTAWTGLRAADVGAPHGRFRVFVLAWLADTAGDPRWLGNGDRSAAALAADFGHERAWTSRDGRIGPPHRGGEPVGLLPTPKAGDATTGHNALTGGRPVELSTHLTTQVALLPTPTSTDHKASGATYAATDTHPTGTTLTDATVRQPERFGQYAPAIARWETVLGRPAPAPMEQDWERWGKARRRRISSRLPVGMRGSIRFIVDGPPRRLSPRFVEWLMGLPDGWVTDTDTTRNEQLKALGNGVVPQQAAAAIRHLLGIREMALTQEMAA